MESSIVHQQLTTISSEASARHTLVCYLQYLIDYRRDVPGKDEYVIYELRSLQSTKYIKQLSDDDPIRRLLSLSDEMEHSSEERNKDLWAELKNTILNL